MQRPLRPSPKPLVAAAVYVLPGLAISHFFGHGFIAAYSVHPLVLVLLLAGPSVFVTNAVIGHYKNSARLVTPWVQWAAWVLFGLVISGLIFLATRGWVAGASSLLVTRVATLELQVVSAARTESRRSVCNRYLELRNGTSTEQFCSDAFSLHGTPLPGKGIAVVGRASPLGLHIQELRVR
jgi:hypothetical protein